MVTPHPNIVAAIDEEENKEKTKRQFANSENDSKQIESLEVQKNYKYSTDHENQRIKPQNIENLEEQNRIQHSTNLQEQHSDILGKQNKEDSNEMNDKSEKQSTLEYDF